MSNIPTQTKLWYIQYPVKIDGVTDDQDKILVKNNSPFESTYRCSTRDNFILNVTKDGEIKL